VRIFLNRFFFLENKASYNFSTLKLPLTCVLVWV
jgi:hypothetical protein